MCGDECVIRRQRAPEEEHPPGMSAIMHHLTAIIRGRFPPTHPTP